MKQEVNQCVGCWIGFKITMDQASCTSNKEGKEAGLYMQWSGKKQTNSDKQQNQLWLAKPFNEHLQNKLQKFTINVNLAIMKSLKLNQLT